MKLAIVGYSIAQPHRKKIQEEMVRRGHECDLLNFSILPIENDVIGEMVEKLRHYDVVHFVFGPGDDVTKVLQTRLMEIGVICPNSRETIIDLDDKIFQMILLAEANIPIPKTIRLVNSKKEEVGKQLGFPFVLKDPYGMQGTEVYLCTEDNFETLVESGKQYIGQEFIKYVADYRIHVAGKKTFCTYERVAVGNDFRANVSLGGTMKKVEDKELLLQLSKLALETTAALSLDYGGVDIITSSAGEMFVLEFNKNPGFKQVIEVTGTPYYEPIADYYESLVK